MYVYTEEIVYTPEKMVRIRYFPTNLISKHDKINIIV